MSWNPPPPPVMSRSNWLPFEISEFPEAHTLDGSEALTTLDDRRFVQGLSFNPCERRKNALYPIMFTSIAAGAISLISLFNGTVAFLESLLYGLFSIFFGALISGIILLIQRSRGTQSMMIFDRLAQTVTMPKGLRWKPVKYPFDQIVPLIGTIWITSVGLPTANYLGLTRPKSSGGFRQVQQMFYGRKPREAWSWLVWYMDKNRPLPPSDTLDQYRERDKQRRKAEGNPLPYARMTANVVRELKRYNEQRRWAGHPTIEELPSDEKMTFHSN